MIKKEKGIALVSLLIVVSVMTIIASTVIFISFDRFEINKLRKMYSDIELLQDKVSNYYLKYGVLPVLRDNTNTPIQYTYTTLDFEKNSGDNTNYYILDLNAMQGISLNYGKEGFENPNASDDVYIINEQSHTIYYVKGIELEEQTHHYLNEVATIVDNVPPSSPQIKIISGTKSGNIYTSDVEIEITQGKDKWSGIGGTQYSLDNGATWQEMNDNSKVISITKKGSYTIRAKTYDNATTTNYSAETQLAFEIDRVEVGTYIYYDVPYTDMHSGIEYTSENGWRYLGTESGTGNHLLISTAIPVVLYYYSSIAGENSKWWDTDTTLGDGERATQGMLKNFDKIPYTQIASGLNVSTYNTAIGRFEGAEVTVDGTTYTAIGDTFKSSTYASKIEKVRTLTLAELNRAVNSANGNTDRAETSTSSGFKDLTGDALGLFDMKDLTGYDGNFYYWLAAANASDTKRVYYAYIHHDYINHSSGGNSGVRPVVVLSSDVEFIKEDGAWKIFSGSQDNTGTGGSQQETPTPTLTLDKTTITKEITSGSTATETLTATLTNATGTLTWTSSDTSVAEVVGSGNTATVTLKAAGSATITVSYGSYSATCNVTVTEKEAESGSGTVSITSAEVSPTSFTSATDVTINLTANIEKSVANETLTFTYKFYRTAGYNAALEYVPEEDFVTTSSDSVISLTKTISSSSITGTYHDFLVTLDISDSSGNIKASKSFDYFQTYYGENATFGVHIPCLPAGTMVTVEVEEEDENGKKRKKRKKKKIEDLTYDDNLVVWDFDNGCFTTVKPLWLMRKQVADEYNLLKFSDGSELKTIRQHRIFNKELGKFTYPMTEETPIGTTTYTEKGKEVKLVSKEVIKEPVEYYNIISDYHMNVFAEGILTSCRLSNLYEIKDMKYVKDGRELVSREEYKDIPDEYFYGLRLAEQPREINRGNDDKNSRTLKEYVLNCVRTQKPKNEVK